jgi:hypothetical protein
MSLLHTQFKKINWLVEDAGEHDRLMFYCVSSLLAIATRQTHIILLDSGHGGQTTCHHHSEVDVQDEGIVHLSYVSY